MIKEKMDQTKRVLKNCESPGLDDIPAEVLKPEGPGVVEALTVICQKMWIN